MLDIIKKTDGLIISLRQISEIEFYSRDLDSRVTVKEWLQELLCIVWMEKDEFSGKRAFGNSSWEYELYDVLVKHRIIIGILDEDGFVEDCDDKLANKIILDIIVEVL